jgi:hypothetical protein
MSWNADHTKFIIDDRPWSMREENEEYLLESKKKADQKWKQLSDADKKRLGDERWFRYAGQLQKKQLKIE